MKKLQLFLFITLFCNSLFAGYIEDYYSCKQDFITNSNSVETLDCFIGVYNSIVTKSVEIYRNSFCFCFMNDITRSMG